MRVLFVSSWFPAPPTNGSKLRVLNLLRQLAHSHEVALVSFTDPVSDDPGCPELRAMCRMLATVPRRYFRPESFRSRLALFGAVPRSLVDTHSPEMERSIARALSAERYDVVVASQLAAAAHVRGLAGAPALFEEIELTGFYERFARAPSLGERLRSGLTWAKHRRYLARLLRSFAACTVASALERDLLSRAVPYHPPAHVIPNCIRLADYAGFHRPPEPGTLIFTGSLSYDANYEAMRWFLERVFPRVLAARPQARLTITGDPAGRALPRSPNVRQTGIVEDIRPLVAASWLSLAPLRHGGGTRLKILESMALGTPVVATRKGAEGLDVVHGEHLLVADEPEELARLVLRLLADGELRAHLAENGRRLVAERYDSRIVGPRFEALVADVARRRTERRPR